MTPIAELIVNRIGMLYTLIFVFLFSVYSGKRIKCIALLAGAFVLTAALAVARSFGAPGSEGMYILTMVMDVLIVVGASVQSSRYKDFRAVLTGFMALAYAVSGEVSARIVMGFTGDMVVAIIVQVSILMLGLGAFYALCGGDYLESLSENQVNWARISVIPILFYVAINSLTIWPNNITDNLGSVFGVVVALVGMYYTAITIIVVFTTGKRTTVRNQNLRFLAGYSDKIDAKLNNLVKEYGAVSDINRELIQIVSYMKSAVADEDFDRLSEEMTKLENMANRQIERFFCENHAINAAIIDADDVARDLGVRLHVDCDLRVDLYDMESEYATILNTLMEKAIRESTVAGGLVVNSEIYLSGSEIALSIVFPVYLPPETYHDTKEFADRFVDEFNREFEKPVIRNFIEKYKAYYGVRVKGSYLVIDVYVGVAE